MGDGGRRGISAVLRFFGIETREKALDTLAWAAPYVGVLAMVLAAVSLAAHRVFGVSAGACGAGAVLGLAYFFLFLARLRRAAVETDDEGRPR